MLQQWVPAKEVIAGRGSLQPFQLPELQEKQGKAELGLSQGEVQLESVEEESPSSRLSGQKQLDPLLREIPRLGM